MPTGPLQPSFADHATPRLKGLKLFAAAVRGRLAVRRRTSVIIGSAMLILLAGAGLWQLRSDPAPSKQPALAAAQGSQADTIGIAKPQSHSLSTPGIVPFTPVVPKGKPQLARLGSSAYNSQYQSYSFDDTYLALPVRVSQQLMPPGQTSVSGLIDSIAASLKASGQQAFTMANGQPAYLVTGTAEAGKQAVVFSAKGKLIFVQSAYEHDAGEWLGYLNSFR